MRRIVVVRNQDPPDGFQEQLDPNPKAAFGVMSMGEELKDKFSVQLALSSVDGINGLLIQPLVHYSKWATLITRLGRSELVTLGAGEALLAQALFSDHGRLWFEVVNSMRGGVVCRGDSLRQSVSLVERLGLAQAGDGPQVVAAAKKEAKKFRDTDLIGAKLGEPLVAGLLSAAFPGTIVSRDGVDGEADRMVRLPEGDSALRELLNPGGDEAEVSGLPSTE